MRKRVLGVILLLTAILSIVSMSAAWLSLPVTGDIYLPRREASRMITFLNNLGVRSRHSKALPEHSIGLEPLEIPDGPALQRAQSAILNDAKKRGYFCMIDLHFRFGQSTLQVHDGTCSHGKTFSECQTCKSIPVPSTRYTP